MGTLKGLAARMNKEADDIETLASDAAVWFAKYLVAELIKETPVDTSRALSNWLINFGAPSNAGTIDFVPGVAGSTEGTNTAAAIQRAHTILDGKIPGEAIYISNVVRYIVYLNQGTSKQAPALYVENAILRAKVALRSKIEAGGFRK